MRRAQAVVSLAVAFGALACGHATTGFGMQDADAHAPPPATPGLVGASIALVVHGSELAVVNPDQGSVSFLDPSSLVVKGTTPVGGEPHALLEAVSGTLLVTNYRDGEVVVIDESSGKVTKRVSVCAGPYGLAASPDATWVAVTCEWDQTLRRIDLATYAVKTLASRSSAAGERSSCWARMSTRRITLAASSTTSTPTGPNSPRSLVPRTASAYRPALDAHERQPDVRDAPRVRRLCRSRTSSRTTRATRPSPSRPTTGRSRTRTRRSIQRS